MSKINVSIDTKSNTVECSIDGERLEGVRDLCLYNGNEDYQYIEIISDAGTSGVDNDVHKTVRVMAKEDGTLEYSNVRRANQGLVNDAFKMFGRENNEKNQRLS